MGIGLIQRRLGVSYDPPGADIYKFLPCPQTDAGERQATTCLTVFGRYSLHVDGEDKQAVYQQFVNQTEALIENGELEQSLRQIDDAGGCSRTKERRQ